MRVPKSEDCPPQGLETRVPATSMEACSLLETLSTRRLNPLTEQVSFILCLITTTDLGGQFGAPQYDPNNLNSKIIFLLTLS